MKLICARISILLGIELGISLIVYWIATLWSILLIYISLFNLSLSSFHGKCLHYLSRSKRKFNQHKKSFLLIKIGEDSWIGHFSWSKMEAKANTCIRKSIQEHLSAYKYICSCAPQFLLVKIVIQDIEE